MGRVSDTAWEVWLQHHRWERIWVIGSPEKSPMGKSLKLALLGSVLLMQGDPSHVSILAHKWHVCRDAAGEWHDGCVREELYTNIRIGALER
jgi:hypothetical protein